MLGQLALFVISSKSPCGPNSIHVLSQEKDFRILYLWKSFIHRFFGVCSVRIINTLVNVPDYACRIVFFRKMCSKYFSPARIIQEKVMVFGEKHIF